MYLKKITIIGANSHIARNVLFLLRQRDDIAEVKLYDFADEQADVNENYQKININKQTDVDKIDMDCDVIFMFVGKTGSANGFDEYDTFIDINEKALLNVLNSYRKQNSRAKIIFPSTRLVYKGKKGVQRETDQKEFKTIYAMNKYACEKYLEMYHAVYDINYCIFRICVPYGTLVQGSKSYGTAEFMLSKAREGKNISLYGDGSQRRTLTYMGDLCANLIDGAFSTKCCNDVYNIGGENYSLKEMAELIAKNAGVEVDFVAWPEVSLKVESGDTVFDDTKLIECIGKIGNTKFADWVKKEMMA